MQTGFLQLGYVENLIVSGPTGLAAALTNPAALPAVREVTGNTTLLLRTVEGELRARGLPTGGLTTAIGHLGARGEGMSESTVSAIGRELSVYPTGTYMAAATSAMAALSAASRFSTEDRMRERVSSVLRPFGRQSEDPKELLDAMEAAYSAISARDTTDGTDLHPQLITLKNLFERTGTIFDDIANGKVSAPPDRVFLGLAGVWAKSMEYLWKYYMAIDPAAARRMLWDAVLILKHLFPSKDLRGILRGLNDELLATSLGMHLEHEKAMLWGETSLLRNYHVPLAAFEVLGLTAADGVETPQRRRHGADNETAYLRHVLSPAIEEGCEFALDSYSTSFHESVRRFLYNTFRLYLRRRAISPHAPLSVVFMQVCHDIQREDMRDALGGYVPPVYLPYYLLAVAGVVISRRLAALPDNIFERYQGRIAADFPDALHYRAGAGRYIDRARIENALRFPPQGVGLIMHLGVGGDLELVKDSLSHISRDGRVVIVDMNPSVFEPFRQDPVTSDALRNGRLVISKADYKGSAFGIKYAGRADRVYAIHPVGVVEDVLRKVTARGGIAVYQDVDNRDNLKYQQVYRPMIDRGPFARLAGYSNGPAWFDTGFSRQYSNLGIMLLVARKR